MRRQLLGLCLVVWLTSASPLWAGLHLTGESPPVYEPDYDKFITQLMQWRECGPSDPKLNKDDAPQRKKILEHISQLRLKKVQGALSPDEIADLGYYLIRARGTQSEPGLYLYEAINLLVPASRQFPQHFAIYANLGTAFHLMEAPDALEQAEMYLTQAVELAPAAWRIHEANHLRLVKIRRRAMLQANRDSSFGRPAMPELDAILTPSPLTRVQIVGPSGRWEIGKLADSERAKLPQGSVETAMMQVQQLLIWLPYDARLFWFFGELAQLQGQHRAAYRAMDNASYNNSALSGIRLRVLLLGEFLLWQDVLSRSQTGTEAWLAQTAAAGLLFTAPGDAAAFAGWAQQLQRSVKSAGGFEDFFADSSAPESTAPEELLKLTTKHWVLMGVGAVVILLLLGVQCREWLRRRSLRPRI